MLILDKVKDINVACYYNLVGKIEEKLADKAEPILGFRPSSKLKRGRIGIIISIICLVIVIIELIRSGVI